MSAKSTIKKMFPRTLFGRSLLILVTPVVLIQMVTTYFFFDRHWEKMTDRLAFSVAGEIAVLVDRIEQARDVKEVEGLIFSMERSLDLDVAFVPDAKVDMRKKHKGPWGVLIADKLDRVLVSNVRRPHAVLVDMRSKIIEIDVQLSDGLLIVEVPRGRLFSSSSYIFLLWMIAASIVLLVIAILFMRNQIRPIRRLAIAAERFGMGREVPFFKVEGATEVRRAARAFIEMRERISRQIHQRTTMLAGVSHDLRTPLTRMKLQVALLPDSADKKAFESDIADMEKMIESYLSFARGEGEEQAVRTDIAAMLVRLCENMATLECRGDLWVVVRPLAFERMITNLLTNSKKYAPHVWVRGERGLDSLKITVDDDGPGIPQDKYEDVFRPFYRLEASRNSKTGGVGLGLPIAMDIVHAHGGEIDLEKSPKGGLRVVVTLPL